MEEVMRKNFSGIKLTGLFSLFIVVSLVHSQASRCNLVVPSGCVDPTTWDGQVITVSADVTRIDEGFYICQEERDVTKPMDVVLAVDQSGSMIDAGNDRNYYAPQVSKEAIDLIKTSAPGSKVGFFGFGNGICEGKQTRRDGTGLTKNTLVPLGSVSDPTHYNALVNQTLYRNDANLDCGTNSPIGTNYYRTFLQADKWLTDPAMSTNSVKAVIMITDGEPSASGAEREEFIAWALAADPDYMVFAIFITNEDVTRARGVIELQELCARSGGNFKQVLTNDKVVLKTVLENMIIGALQYAPPLSATLTNTVTGTVYTATTFRNDYTRSELIWDKKVLLALGDNKFNYSVTFEESGTKTSSFTIKVAGNNYSDVLISGDCYDPKIILTQTSIDTDPFDPATFVMDPKLNELDAGDHKQMYKPYLFIERLQPQYSGLTKEEIKLMKFPVKIYNTQGVTDLITVDLQSITNSEAEAGVSRASDRMQFFIVNEVTNPPVTSDLRFDLPQLIGGDTVFVEWINPEDPRDRAIAKIPVAGPKMISLSSGTFMDTNGDGHVDSIFIKLTSNPDLTITADHLTEIMKSGLITLPAARNFTITSYRLIPGAGFGLSVTEGGPIKTYITPDDSIAITGKVLSAGGKVMEKKIAVYDKVAPIIMSQNFTFNGASSKTPLLMDFEVDSITDTLIVIFSEPVKQITNVVPFHFLNKTTNTSYTANLVAAEYPDTKTVKFSVTSLTGAIKVLPGDSIWIYESDRVGDVCVDENGATTNNFQNNTRNQKREITISTIEAPSWDRSLALYHGADSLIKADETITPIEIRFTWDGGNVNYVYTKVSVEVTTFSGKNQDRESLTLSAKGNTFSKEISLNLLLDGQNPAQGDGKLQVFEDDSIIVVFRNNENPKLAFDTLRTAIPFISKGTIRLTSGFFFDNNGDGHVDSIFIKTTSTIDDGLTAARLTEMMNSNLIVLPSARKLTITHYQLIANAGIGLSVTEDGPVKTYVTSEDTIEIKGKVLSLGGTIKADKIAVYDKIAPIVMDGNFTYDGESEKIPLLIDYLVDTVHDTLIVRFSEPVKQITNAVPFHFLDKINNASYTANLDVVDYPDNKTVRFSVNNLTGTEKIFSGDSVWIHESDRIGDICVDENGATVTNYQNNAGNQKRKISITIKRDPVPLKPYSTSPVSFSTIDDPILQVPSDIINIFTQTQLHDLALQKNGTGNYVGMPIQVVPEINLSVIPDLIMEGNFSIFDAVGNVIVNNKTMAFDSKAKTLNFIWNGKNMHNRLVSTGSYLGICSIVIYYQRRRLKG